MCGLAGWAGDVGGDEPALRRMCTALAHRGPDEERILLRPGRVALGFTRLSIIDLETGSQPISNEDGTVVCCCNGEIYNFVALRTELQRRGHRFSTRSDAEVIVHLYEDFGPDFLGHLQGMFAIALWDTRSEDLLLARDRIGVKPMYWASVGGGVVFASEPAAILASRLVSARPDLQAVTDYLTLQYVPAPESGFAGIGKLAPGEVLHHHHGRTSIRSYWELDFSRKRRDVSAGDAVELVDALLADATAGRLVADVPLGAFLSGGIDSSLVVSYMAEQSSTVKTYSITFGDESISEGAHAARVAELYGTQHHELTVEPHMVRDVTETVLAAGEPFADSSAIPTYLLSAFTRRDVTVALSGDGGDEAFGGYARYKRACLADRVARTLGVGEETTWPRSAAHRLGRLGRLARGLDFLGRPSHDRYAGLMTHFSPAQIESLATPELLATVEAGRAWNSTLRLGDARGVDRYLELDTATYLPGDLLLKVDRMSMAHSLEVRSPLLDYRVHELAASLPAEVKLQRGHTKWVLKEVAARRGLPSDLVHRPKRGFGIPLGSWFRHELREWTFDVLLDPKTIDRGYFRRDRVVELLNRHMSGDSNESARIYNLIALELWHRGLIDAPAT